MRTGRQARQSTKNEEQVSVNPLSASARMRDNMTASSGDEWPDWNLIIPSCWILYSLVPPNETVTRCDLRPPICHLIHCILIELANIANYNTPDQRADTKCAFWLADRPLYRNDHQLSSAMVALSQRSLACRLLRPCTSARTSVTTCKAGTDRAAYLLIISNFQLSEISADSLKKLYTRVLKTRHACSHWIVFAYK